MGHFAEPCWAWRAEQAGIRAGTRSIWAIVQCWAAGGFHFSEGKRKCEKLEPENSFLPSLFFFFLDLSRAFHNAGDLNQAWNMNATLIFLPSSVTLMSQGAG